MKRYFSGITAQQAPMPRIARHGPVWSSWIIQIAFEMPHCTRLKSALPSTAISNSDMIDEVIDANRLARSHPMTRPNAVRRDRGRSSGSGFSGADVIDVIGSSLHQRDARIVPVHEQADAEADGEEHQHDECDRL